MDATTLLGTLPAELLGATARLVVRAAGWPSPARLVDGTLGVGSRVLLVAAVLAWAAGVFAVLVAVSDRGSAGAPARGPRPAPPPPPRRVRAVVPERTPERVLVPDAPVPATSRPVAPAPVAPAPVGLAEVAPAPPAPRPVVPVAVPIAVVVPVAVVAPAIRAPVAHDVPAREQGAAVSEPEPVRLPAPLPVRPHGAGRTAAAGSRCRRCTQPRCWPSAGERHPARVPGTGAPRACRTSLTAGTAHRCGAADPWYGERCTVPVRARPARPGPGSDRAPALPR